MHNTAQPVPEPGPACHYDPHNAVPQGRPPASTLLHQPGTPLSKALSGKAGEAPPKEKAVASRQPSLCLQTVPGSAYIRCAHDLPRERHHQSKTW